MKLFFVLGIVGNTRSMVVKNQERQSQNENKKMYNKRNNINVYTFLVMLRLMFN